MLWRWRPVDERGEGTLAKVSVSGASSWGTDIRAIGTYIRSAEQGLYNLYVVDPSEQQILRYSPAADGSGYPAAPSGFLATAQDMDTVEGLYIDGDVYIAADGDLKRFVGGQSGGWEAELPRDELLRPAPKYVDQAQMKLQPATPLAYQARRSPEPRPEPIGLDEHPGGSALSVRDLWYALLGQLELQLNRATFDTWVKGTVIERYEDGVLWVRPKHLYAREWLEKHLQQLLDESLSRLAGVPVTVRFLGEAAAQAAGG